MTENYMNMYLVEDYSPGLNCEENDLIVALTPEACYHLGKAGIEYSIPEDFYDLTELLAGEEYYYKSQLQWIQQLDKFLQNNIKELQDLNLGLGSLYYYYLKTMVLDAPYIRSYILRNLIEKLKPSSIIFVSSQPELPTEDSFHFTFQANENSLYSRILPVFCAQHAIPLTLIISQSSSNGNEAVQISMDASIINKLKRILGKYQSMRTVHSKLYFPYQYLRKNTWRKRSTKKKANVLMLRPAYGMLKGFAIDAIRSGYTLYQLSDGYIFRYSRFKKTRYLNLNVTKTNDTSIDNNAWIQSANLLDSTDLITQINEQCQLDVSEIMLPKLRYFISKVCPRILDYFRASYTFLQEEKIDFVIAPYALTPMELGTLAAANFNNVRTICLVHGDDVYPINWWRVLQLQNFGIHIYSNREAMEHAELLSIANNIHRQLFFSPDRMLNARNKRQHRTKQKKHVRKQRIVYLPTMFVADYCRVESALYPDTWYYNFQKALIEYFATRTEFKFVWKGLPQSDWIYNPIPNYIRQSNLSNIEIATNPFVEHLLSADRVICDYVSTGFYEAIVAGVPTMSLYRTSFKIRESALEHFGNTLRSFTNISEAIHHIDEFLDSDPELYITDIDMGNESVLDILESIAGKDSIKSSNSR